MENKNEETTKLNEEQMEQVKGGAAYIKFDGVDGECKDSKHEKWINVLSVGLKRR